MNSVRPATVAAVAAWLALRATVAAADPTTPPATMATPPSSPAAAPAPPAATLPPDIRVCVPSSYRLDNNTQIVGLPDQTIASCDKGLATQYERATAGQPRIRSSNVVFIYVGDGQGTLGAAGVSKIAVSVYPPGQPASGATATCADAASLGSSQFTFDNSKFWPCWVVAGQSTTAADTVAFPDAAQNDTVDVAVTAGPITYHRFIRFTKPLTLESSAAGFWIPVGLFGTDFHANSDGITLAALPVGVAWGGQYNFSGSDYLGLSLFVNWSIAPQKTSGTSNGNYTLSAATGGAFFDLDGYVYLGYGYAIDFRSFASNSTYSNPGSMVVLGVGPRLLDVLKDQASPSK